MKNFKLFEKCNRRIARRVTLIAVLLAMCMPQVWASDPHFHLTGAPSIGSWSNSATEWKLSSPASSALSNDATFNEYCTYMWLSEGDYFGLNNGTDRYSRNDNNDQEIKGDKYGAGVFGYPTKEGKTDKAFHYIGATGLVRINAAQTGSGNSYGNQGEYYPYIWVEESLETAILTGSKIMFYFGIADSWKTNWFYLSKEGDQSANKAYKQYFSMSTRLETRIAVAYVDANTTYYIASAQSGGTCIKMSSNAAAGNLYSLNSSGGNNIYVNTGNVPHFATTSVSKEVGTTNSTIAATDANSIYGNAYTFHYYYTTDGGSTFTKFDPTDISDLTTGRYIVYALGWDGHILVKSDNSVTLDITVPITLNANGGSDGAVTSINATYGVAASTGNIAGGSLPTKTDYVFTGFYTSGGTKVIDADGEWVSDVSGYTNAGGNWTCTAASTLYAHWEHRYNLKGNGGIMGDWNTWLDLPKTATNVYGKSYTLTKNQVYVFKVVDRDGSDTYWGNKSGTNTNLVINRAVSGTAQQLYSATSEYENITITPDVTGDYTFSFNTSTNKLTVTYPESYKVIYNKGTGEISGSVPTDDTYYLNGADVTVKDNVGLLQKAGYVFAGWATSDGASSVGTGMDPADSDNDTYAISSTTHNLYPVWKPGYYLISLSGSGSDGTKNPGGGPFMAPQNLSSKAYTVNDVCFSKSYYQYGGTSVIKGASNTNTNAFIFYDTKTTKTSVYVYAWNKNSKAESVVYNVIAEGESTDADQSVSIPAGEGKIIAIDASSDMGARVGISVSNNSNLFVTQIKVVESGTTLPLVGEKDYQLAFPGRPYLYGKSGSINGINIVAYDHCAMAGDNSLKLRSGTYYVQFTTTAATQLKVSAGDGSAGYVCTNYASASSTGVSFAKNTTTTINLNSAGTYYITGADGSNTYLTKIAFDDFDDCTEPTAFSHTAVTSNSVTLSITDGEDTGDYEFYYSTSSATPNSVWPANATSTSKTPTISGLTSSTNYYIWVRSKCSESSKSDWVALTGSYFTTTSSCSATANAGSDKETSVGVGVDMAATAASSGYTGAWSIKASSPSTDAGQLGTTSSNTMTFTPNQSGTYTLIWTVTDNSDGSCSATDEATVTVTRNTPTQYSVSGTATICSGDNTNITLSDSEEGASYQLKKGGVAEGDAKEGTGEALTWKVSAAGTYTVSAVQTTKYTAGDMTGSAVITFKTNTAIETQPTSIAKANVGAEQTLSVVATGSNLEYQWYSCSDAEKTGATELIGETGDELSVTPEDVGVIYYYCVVSGDCGDDVTSNVVSITAKNAISPTLTYNAYSVAVGSTLTATLNKDGSTGSVTYISSNDAVATVASDGTVTGVSAGTVTITATIAATSDYWSNTVTSSTITVTAPTYDVTHTLYDVEFVNGTPAGSDKATRGTDYEATFEVVGRYTLPTDVTVTVGGVEVTKDTEYTWNSSTGELVVIGSYITGDIEIEIVGIPEPIPTLITYNLHAPKSTDDQPSNLDTTSVVTVAATLKGDTLKNFTNMVLGSSFRITGKGKDKSGGTWTAKIGSTPADSTTTDANSVRLSFDVHSDYELNVSSITLHTMTVGDDKKLIYRACITDGVTSAYGRVAPDGGKDATVVFESFSGKKFSGTVTLKMWVWGEASNDFRIKTPIQIDGSLTKKPAPSGYAITEGAHTNGTIAITDGSSAITEAEEDATVHIEATPSTGYNFTSWTITKTSDVSDVTSSVSLSEQTAEATFTMPAYGVTVNAMFAAINYAITHNAAENGTYTISVAGGAATSESTTANYNQTITLAATPDSHYKLQAWNVTKTSSGDAVSMATANTFVMPAEAVTIAPTFGRVYTVSFYTHGGSSQASIEQSSVGGAITMPAAPTYAGHEFVNWVIGGETFDPGDAYTPTANITAHATWKANCAGGGGSEPVVLFSQNFNSAAEVAYDGGAGLSYSTANTLTNLVGSGSNLFTSITSVSGQTSSGIAINSSTGVGDIDDATGLFLVRKKNSAYYWSMTRTADFAATAPTAIAVEMDIYFDNLSSGTSQGVTFAIGDGFEDGLKGNTIPSSSNVHSGFNIMDNSSPKFCQYGSTTTIYSTAITEATWYSIVWVINNTGSTLTYEDPDGSGTSTVNNDCFDIWLKTQAQEKSSFTRIVNNQAATTGSKDLQNIHIGGHGDKQHLLMLDNIVVTDIASAGGSSCYYITYDGNGADAGSVNDDRAYSSGDNVYVSTCESSGNFTREGYEFNGWNNKPDGSGTYYNYWTNSDKVVITKDTTLYAQWKIVVDEDNENLSGFDTPQYKDVVVRNGAKLTITQTMSVRNITVESGSTLHVAKNGEEGITLSIDSLSLVGGYYEKPDHSTVYDMPRVYIDPLSTLSRTNSTINFDIAVTNNFHPIAVPFPVKVSDVKYADPAVNDAYYLTHYIIKTYDGAARANGSYSCWTPVYSLEQNEETKEYEDVYLQPGRGYILAALRRVGKLYEFIRFPMKNVPSAWTTLGEQGTVDDVTKNVVAVEAYLKDGDADGSKTPNANKGWNILGVPFMSRYQATDDIIQSPTEIIQGHFDYSTNKWDDDEIRYVTVPTYDFSEYNQYSIEDEGTILLPGWCFFVQVETSGNLKFLSASEAENEAMPIYASKREQERKPTVKTGIILTGANAKDKTTIIVSDKYNAAEYEINADLEKMFGENGYTLATYTLSGETRLAYNAMNNADIMNVIPVGYRAPEEGEYTFSINPRYAESEAFEQVNLIDYEEGVITNLLQSSYSFTTARTQNDARFAINVVKRQDTATDVENVQGGDAQNGKVRKVLINDKMYIILDGKMYDATGKSVK